VTEQEIYIEALNQPDEAERRRYLDEACRDDAPLRARLENLLRRSDRLGSFLERPPGCLAATAEVAVDVELIGTQVGPYRILEQIGEGGFGVVFLAEQATPIRRRVALKIVKPGMDTRQVLARFEAERQALALMDYPGIAKVFDAGVTDHGRSFFVMELVQGVPITDYCDQCNLSTRERLELFIAVCQAVQHAHQKGIIHRDLKPTNVLVALQDGRPVPKIIDFGVAKAIEQRLTEQTLTTAFAQMVGTPMYMSPEQAELSPLGVDTRTDIYSLGVLLYELLTGTTPFDRDRLHAAGYDELRRIIREEEPPRPSTRLTTLAAGEATTIAEHRRTDGRRLRQQVRGELDWIVMKCLDKDRNRRYETASGLALDIHRYLDDEPVQACPPSTAYRFRKFARRHKAKLATASVVTVALLFAVASLGWAMRDSTARHAKVAGQVELILTEADQLQREQKWAEALIAVRRADAVVAGGDADVATAHRVRQRLKDLEFLDRLDQLRMQRTTLVDGQFDNAGTDRNYARAFREYGVDVEAFPVEASIDRLQARPALVIPLAAALDDWVLVRRQISGTDDARWKPLVAVARGLDPQPLRDRLRSTWGQPNSEAEDELRRLAESIDLRAQHPATLHILARTLLRVNQSNSALRLLRNAQYVYPGDFWLNYHLGRALYDHNDHEGAIRFFTAAVSIRPRSSGAHTSLGIALKRQERLDEAVAAHRKAIELDPRNALAYINLGVALAEQGKLDEAVAAYRKAIELAPKIAAAYHNLGNALADQGKLDEAIAAYRRAIELYPSYALAYNNLGNALSRQGDNPRAIAAYQKAIALDPEFALGHNGLAWVLTTCPDEKLRDPGAALALVTKAVELDPQNGAYVNTLGVACYRTGDFDAAVSALEQSMKLRKGGDSFDWFFLAMAEWQLGNKDTAREWYEKAVRWMEERAPRNEELIRFRSEAAELLGVDDKSERAALEATRQLNQRAWSLATSSDRETRDPHTAVELAQEAVKLAPDSADSWNTLGVAQYRDGNFKEAISALQKYRDLRTSDAEYSNPFFLAMAHWQLGHKEEARRWYDKGVLWMDAHNANSETMVRFRNETAELLDINH